MSRSNRRLLIAALWLAGLFTIAISVRGAEQMRRLRSRSAEPIEPWMNIRYIAHAYNVPAAVIHQALGLPADRPDRRPLWQIARSQGRPTGVLVADIDAAISRAHMSLPPTPPPPPTAGPPPVPPGDRQSQP